MQNEQTILVNRTRIEKPLVAKTPYNQIIAALSLALFFVVGAYAGGTWLLVTVIGWVAALVGGVIASMRRAVRLAAQLREEDRQVRENVLATRRTVAEWPDATYEERSAEPAARFGRLEQPVPSLAIPAHVHRARHAAGLVAEGVVRTTLRGRPFTAFDLEVANEVDLDRMIGKARFERAFTISACYLTVCAVTLPFPLPFLSSLAAWSPGLIEAITGEAYGDDHGVPDELRHTDDPEFAALMLSVPAVRQAAHDLDLLWTVSGDVLTTSVLTRTGLPAWSILRRADALAALADAFPWDRLQAYRRTAAPAAPWPEHRSPLLTHQSWLPGEILGPGVLRWSHQPLGDTGAYAFQSTSIDLGEPR